MSAPNLKRISIRSKVIRSQIFEIGSRDPGHAHLGVVMVRTHEESVLYVGTKYEADSSIPSKVKGGPKISKFGRDPKPHPF